MTRERLESYRSNRDEITELAYKLEHLDDNDRFVTNDVVHDYRTGYPKAISVIGIDHERKQKEREKYTKLLEELRTECTEVEDWINNIPDGLARRIFRMRYMDGMEIETICMKVHMGRSSVYRKVDSILSEERDA